MYLGVPRLSDMSVMDGDSCKFPHGGFLVKADKIAGRPAFYGGYSPDTQAVVLMMMQWQDGKSKLHTRYKEFEWVRLRWREAYARRLDFGTGQSVCTTLDSLANHCLVPCRWRWLSALHRRYLHRSHPLQFPLSSLRILVSPRNKSVGRFLRQYLYESE